MEMANIAVRSEKLLKRQAEYLRGRVRKYLGLKSGMSPHKNNNPKRNHEQLWTPDDVVCITNLLSIYNTIHKHGVEAMEQGHGEETSSRDRNKNDFYRDMNKRKVKKVITRKKVKKVITRKKVKKVIRRGR